MAPVVTAAFSILVGDTSPSGGHWRVPVGQPRQEEGLREPGKTCEVCERRHVCV